MKKIVLSLLILAVGAVMIMTGCSKQSSGSAVQSGGSAPGGVTIRWAYWGAEARVRISQQAIDLFQAANPGILVNPEVSGGSGDHFPKIDTQLAGGNGPDIIQLGGNINDYVKRGVLLPLDQYTGSILNTSVIDAGALESGTFNGQLYGVSTGVTMPALVYNKSLLGRSGVPLPKVSMTYDEFRAYLVSLKAKLPAGVYPMQDIGSLASNSTPFGYWLRHNGTPIYIEETNSTAVTPEVAKKYLDLFKDYRDNGLVPPADIAAGYAENNADTSALIAGKAAIGFIVTNQLAGYQSAATDELDLIELPGAEAAKALWPQPSQFYTVNKDSKNPELAVKFIDFLVNNPDAAKVLGNDRGASSSSSARAVGASNANDGKVLKYLEIAGPHSSRETTHLPNDTELNSTLYLIYQNVAFGKISTVQGGQQIYDLLVRLINK